MLTSLSSLANDHLSSPMNSRMTWWVCYHTIGKNLSYNDHFPGLSSTTGKLFSSGLWYTASLYTSPGEQKGRWHFGSEHKELRGLLGKKMNAARTHAGPKKSSELRTRRQECWNNSKQSGLWWTLWSTSPVCAWNSFLYTNERIGLHYF